MRDDCISLENLAAHSEVQLAVPVSADVREPSLEVSHGSFQYIKTDFDPFLSLPCPSSTIRPSDRAPKGPHAVSSPMRWRCLWPSTFKTSSAKIGECVGQ